MAIKHCWATNRRESSLKGVMKLKEIGHDQSPVGVTLLVLLNLKQGRPAELKGLKLKTGSSAVRQNNTI